MVSFRGGRAARPRGLPRRAARRARRDRRLRRGPDARRAAARAASSARVSDRRLARLRRRRSGTHPDDAGIAEELTAWHARYNAELFAGELRPLAVRVSRRMRARLGHYVASNTVGEPAEIAISRRHLRRHGWKEALAHAPARDGAPVAGRARAADRSRGDVPREGARGRDRAVRATHAGALAGPGGTARKGWTAADGP